jgi:hypothetical protein
VAEFVNLFAFCDLHASRWHTWPFDARVESPRYFDRQGFPIPGDQGAEWVGSATRNWAYRMQDRDYVVVAQDELPDGAVLSTVWLGLDHGWLGRPLFFETMRFLEDPSGARKILEFPVPDDAEPVTQMRYSSEEEARAMHHAILRLIRLREANA